MKKVLVFTPLDLKRYVRGCCLAGLDAELGYDISEFDRYDGLLLPGGDDVDPRLYGRKNEASFNIDREYDKGSIKAVEYFFNHNKPILGICKGMQVINVAFGGTLLQDILGHKDFTSTYLHTVTELCHNRLSVYYNHEFLVNSIHHQAIDKLGDELKATYISQDGIVEAIEHKSKKILAVQWHPERLLDTGIAHGEGIKVFRAFKEMFES